MGAFRKSTPLENPFCHKETSVGTVYFKMNHLPWGNRLRSFRISNKNTAIFIRILRKIDFPETFARRFLNFEDIDLRHEEEFLGSSRQIEWCIERLDWTTLRRDNFFGYATSSAFTTSRVDMTFHIVAIDQSMRRAID